MKDNIIKFRNGKINRKKMIITISVIAVIVAIIIMSIIYSVNKQFRNFLDTYLFRKNISVGNVNSIEIDYETNINIIPHGKYIDILVENTLKQYNSSGKLEKEIEVKINNPVYHNSEKYLAIGEENSSKLYLISGNNILWEKEIDGQISKVDVNPNGYVSVILKGTTHKSVIVTYDIKGNELFKTYLSKTTAIDACMSNDNKYLGFAEINTSGTIIQSNVKIISVEKAKEEPANSIIYTYAAEPNSLITNIKYQDKNKLICMYDDSIHLISDDIDEVLIELNENIKKADIELSNYSVRAVEKSSGIFSADTILEMINITNKKITEYTIESVAKSIYCNGNVVAVNLGSEVHFINTYGWLIKKYDSTQEVRNVVLCDNLAGIVYRDKIELIIL